MISDVAKELTPEHALIFWMSKSHKTDVTWSVEPWFQTHFKSEGNLNWKLLLSLNDGHKSYLLSIHFHMHVRTSMVHSHYILASYFFYVALYTQIACMVGPL